MARLSDPIPTDNPRSYPSIIYRRELRPALVIGGGHVYKEMKLTTVAYRREVCYVQCVPSKDVKGGTFVFKIRYREVA